MEKKLLACDVCGGKITIQAGGKRAICEYCGAEYTIERLKEKFDGIKVSVTGSSDDVEQWKALTKTYVKNCDFESAEKTVKQILEASPEDEYANDLYAKLQELKYFEVRNGELVKYHGRSANVSLPSGITTIGLGAFRYLTCLETVNIPEGVNQIENMAFENCKNLSSITMPKSLKKIGESVFSRCGRLTKVTIPENVRSIETGTFSDCTNLNSISFPEGLTTIGGHAFNKCENLTSVSIPKSVKEIAAGAFFGCKKLTSVELNTNDIEMKVEDGIGPFSETPWQWRREGRCQYCGWHFKGTILKKCTHCHRRKDY